MVESISFMGSQIYKKCQNISGNVLRYRKLWLSEISGSILRDWEKFFCKLPGVGVEYRSVGVDG